MLTESKSNTLDAWYSILPNFLIVGADFVKHFNLLINSALLQTPFPFKNYSIRPIGIFSRKLTDTEKRYNIYDREVLAIYSAIKYFRHHQEAYWSRPQTVNPCFHPEVYQRLRVTIPTTRIILPVHIVHVKGDENTVAVALSRINAVLYLQHSILPLFYKLNKIIVSYKNFYKATPT